MLHYSQLETPAYRLKIPISSHRDGWAFLQVKGFALFAPFTGKSTKEEL